MFTICIILIVYYSFIRIVINLLIRFQFFTSSTLINLWLHHCIVQQLRECVSDLLN